MRFSKTFFTVFLFLCWPLPIKLALAGEVPHKLALGATTIGGQIHWGFSKRWALELRVLTGEADSDAGTVSSSAYGARGYWYFRPPSRTRFLLGGEVASTYSRSSSYNYETKGMAFGGFIGTEVYLLKRLSIGLDAGPYFLTTKVRGRNTSDGEVTFVINSFMNFYFL